MALCNYQAGKNVGLAKPFVHLTCFHTFQHEGCALKVKTSVQTWIHGKLDI